MWRGWLVVVVGCGHPTAHPIDAAQVGDVSLVDGAFGPDSTAAGDPIDPPTPACNGLFELPGLPKVQAADVISIATGDVNGDGHLDLVISESYSFTVALGRGDGTFAAPISHPFVDNARIVLADVDGDGKLDVIGAGFAAISSGGGVGVSRGLGNGDFGPTVTYGGDAPLRVAVGDVTGDGKPDLVVAYDQLRQLWIYPNTGGSLFGAPRIVATDGNPAMPVIADLDGDGKLDVAVASYDSIDVFRNPGGGAFAAKTRYPMNGWARNLAIGDVTGDGKPDLVTYDVFGVQSVATVLPNVGGGAFGPRIDYPLIGDSPDGIVLADFTGDGRLDAACASVGQLVNVLAQTSTGTFAPTRVVPAFQPLELASGDFDGDGRIDLAVAAPFGIDILANGGVGTFVRPTPLAVTGTMNAGLDIPIEDVTGDGHPDAVVATNGALTIVPGNGDGTFGTPITYPGPSTPLQLAMGDVDGDGHRDLLVASYGSLSLYRGQAGPLLQRTTIALNDPGPAGIAIADLVEGGAFEIAVTSPNGNLRILHRDATGTLVASAPYPIVAPTTSDQIVWVNHYDLDRDGHQDLVVSSNFTLSVFLGNGDGTLGARRDYGPTTTGAIAIGDLDGDGLPDVASGGHIWRGNGDGTLSSASAVYAGYTNVKLRDIDGDGALDVISTNGSTIQVRFHGAQGPYEEFYAAGWYGLGVGDLDGDGRPDVATIGHSGDQAEILFARCRQ